MIHRDSPTLREEERHRDPAEAHRTLLVSIIVECMGQEEVLAAEESKCETLSRPGGFHNDPDVPTNPNEARERYLRRLRPPRTE